MKTEIAHKKIFPYEKICHKNNGNQRVFFKFSQCLHFGARVYFVNIFDITKEWIFIDFRYQQTR